MLCLNSQCRLDSKQGFSWIVSGSGYEARGSALMLHTQIEEEVLYPAAILIGEYLKLKLNT